MVKVNIPNTQARQLIRTLVGKEFQCPTSISIDDNAIVKALFQEESYGRSRRVRKKVCYDIIKMQKEERRTTRMATIATRSDKAAQGKKYLCFISFNAISPIKMESFTFFSSTVLFLYVVQVNFIFIFVLLLI